MSERLDGAAKIVRERISPRLRDPDYLVLSDLWRFLSRFQSDDRLRVLDYGAGYSPYRSLFPNADFRRADYEPISDVDYVLPYDSTICESDAVFELVLSTQVAEHLPVPQKYFAEALRILKPEGVLIITTHGCWEEHGVPFDFQRWTADGLRRDLEKAGFVVDELFKLTTSERCQLFFLVHWLSFFNARRRDFLSRMFSRCVRSLVQLLRPAVHWIVDEIWRDRRIVGSDRISQDRFYAIIAAVAHKPPRLVVS